MVGADRCSPDFMNGYRPTKPPYISEKIFFLSIVFEYSQILTLKNATNSHLALYLYSPCLEMVAFCCLTEPQKRSQVMSRFWGMTPPLH